MQTNERDRDEVLIVDDLGPVYSDKVKRILTTDDTLYYSKGGAWVAIGATPSAHAASHENGGADEISVAGLSGLLADAQTPISGGTARVTHSVNQSINNATTTALAFDTETFDTATLHDTSTNNSRLTAGLAGKYLCEATVRFAANSTGKRLVLIRKNGTTIYGVQEQNAVPSPDETHVSVSVIVDLAATDYVECAASQNSGGALNVEASLTHFAMVYVNS